MNPLDLVRAPVRIARALTRAGEDLNAIAERARRDPDPVEEIQRRLDSLLARLDLLTLQTSELVEGGADLTATAKRIDSHLRVFAASLPQIMKALGAVEQLEDAVETVAETIEPLQNVTSGVGRVAKRLSGAPKP